MEFVKSSGFRMVLALSVTCSLTSAVHAEDKIEEEPDSNANAEPVALEPDETKKYDRFNAEPDDLGHARQFGLRAALVAGYRMVLRYDESPFCREYDPAKSAADQVKFCGHGGPLALDLGLSFSPFDFIEPYVWARFGLAGEEKTDTQPVLILGAGTRIYTMSDSALKIYVEPAIGLELEAGQGNQPWARFDYKKDVVFHVAAGPQFDLARNVGVFIDGGITLGILRAIHSSLELKAGVQARLP